MSVSRKFLLAAACLIGAGVFGAQPVRPAYGSGFTDFADDEDVCREVGARAIKGASGPSAARHYDVAYRRCMAVHGRMRQMEAAQPGEPPGLGNPHSFDFPDAFYSIPYATPGYGYDGFGY